MNKKTKRSDVSARFAFSGPATASPTLDPNSTNLAERLAAKATDAYARSDQEGIEVTGLSRAKLLKILRSFPTSD